VCIPGQERGQSCICVLGISIKCVYQVRRGGSHIYMFYGYQSSVYTRPGEGAVMYMCFRDINQVCIPGQERGQSYKYVLGISIKCVYQARRGGSHVYVF
jgi:hypothetical protein